MRKLTTIMAADIAGYSRLMGDDEAATLEVLRAHRAVVGQGVTRHGGRVVSWSGDGFIADFGSCVEAVRAGITIQNELKSANESLPPERRMPFRIGINLGDVFVEGEDLLGEGVNIAARVQTLCDPGGVYISGTVFDQVRTKLGIEFVFLGERQVKNIVDPVAVYAVAFEGAPAAKGPKAGRNRAAFVTDDIRPAGAGRRAVAGAIDLIVAAFIVYLVAAPIELVFNDVVDVDTRPFFNLAQERVVSKKESALTKVDTGDIVTVEKIIERSVLGLNKHYYRETERQFRKPGGDSYTQVDGSVHREMVNQKTLQPIQRPKAMQFFLLAYLLYLSILEGRPRGAGLGKRAMGIAVRDEEGKPLTFGRSFGRNLAKIASALTIGFGFFMALWTKKRQALHDQLADCRVVLYEEERAAASPSRKAAPAAG